MSERIGKLIAAINEQRAWIKQCGGNERGYIARIGDPSQPLVGEIPWHGDGGKAIYRADINALRKLEAELEALKQGAKS